MDGPNDLDEIDSHFETGRFKGWASAPNETIRVEVKRKGSNQWDEMGRTMSDSSGFEDESGRTWYYWSTYLSYPRNLRYWDDIGPNSIGEFRATQDNIPMATMTNEELFCFGNAISDVFNGVLAYQTCVENTTRSVHIIAPCNGEACLPVDTKKSDFPSARDYEFANGLQGITHDDNYWYLTSSHSPGGIFVFDPKLSRYARVSKNGLQNIDSSDYHEDSFAPGHRHPGDIDLYDNWVYIALEVDGGSATRNAIGAIKSSNFKSSYSSTTHKKFLLPQSSPQKTGGTFPWLARDPKSGYWYSSKFNGSKLYRYWINTDSDGTPTAVQYCGAIELGETFRRVQGGAFSDSGRLYLSTDRNSNDVIVVLEMQSLFLGENINCNASISVSPDVVGTFRVQVNNTDGVDGSGPEEIEGITIWDLADGSVSGVGGQLHVLMIQTDTFSNDNFYFKHVKVSPKSQL